MRLIRRAALVLLVSCTGGKEEDVVLNWSVAPEPVSLSTSYATSEIIGGGEMAILNEDALDLLITPLAFDGEGAELLATDFAPLQEVKSGSALTLSLEVTKDIVLWTSGDFQPSLLVQVSAFTDPVGGIEEPELVGGDESSIPIQFTIVCDEDGDGVDSVVCFGGTDCDDDDPDRGPNAPELCDEIDNDCDGDVDEAGAADEPTWYLDLDRDDYGDGATTTTSCQRPDGYVDNAADCDDLSGAVFPGADELCDEIDNDCDGETDELGAKDAPTWYADADADAQGDPDEHIDTCERPAGYVDNKKDCDDTRDDVYEGAPERCDDVDNDCDDRVDDGIDCGEDTGAP